MRGADDIFRRCLYILVSYNWHPYAMNPLFNSWFKIHFSVAMFFKMTCFTKRVKASSLSSNFSEASLTFFASFESSLISRYNLVILDKYPALEFFSRRLPKASLEWKRRLLCHSRSTPEHMTSTYRSLNACKKNTLVQFEFDVYFSIH